MLLITATLLELLGNSVGYFFAAETGLLCS